MDRARAAAARRRSGGLIARPLAWGVGRGWAGRRPVVVGAGPGGRAARGEPDRRHPAVGAGRPRRRGEPLLRAGAGRHDGRRRQDRALRRRRGGRQDHQGRAGPRRGEVARAAGLSGGERAHLVAGGDRSRQHGGRAAGLRGAGGAVHHQGRGRARPRRRRRPSTRRAARRRRRRRSRSSCWSTRRRCTRRRWRWRS